MLSILFLIVALILILSFICFVIVFYVPSRKKGNAEDIPLPEGKIYEPFWEDMRRWVMEARSMPYQEFSIISFDGLKLYGKYYEYAPGAPIELMFHGYRGSAERDLSGGVQRCFQLGHSALIVDQRCAGKSEGHVITFGIREHRDCLSWIDFMVNHFGSDVRILLTGISMGATTVLLAASKQLPTNVFGVLADCGFHSARDIICSVAASMHLPSGVLYPFVRLGAWLFGRFNLEEISVVDAIKNCKVPVLFFHGLDDDYVPSYMSAINYEACFARKKIVFIPGAGHGLSYPVSPEQYISDIKDFFYSSVC